MPKRNWSEEERKAFGQKMKLAREAKETKEIVDEVVRQTEPKPDPIEQIAPDQDVAELKQQIAELKAYLFDKDRPQGVEVGKSGNLIGEVAKYLIDPENYPDPTIRLAKEPRLKAVNFDFNYELDYEVQASKYENKVGVNMVEPRFYIQLNRVKVDDQGNRTDGRYIAKRMIFHEDPQAAIVIARDNGIELDSSDEQAFLNEMRYLRVRDWLFDIFWPVPPMTKEGVKEEVIGGTIVQVFTKSSATPEEVPFDQLKTKVKA